MPEDQASPQVAEEFIPEIRVVALASEVIAVATTREEGAWKAYCDAVPGRNHECEYQAVLRHGCTLMPEVARAIFPQFADIPYAS